MERTFPIKLAMEGNNLVSIPFKREGAWKVRNPDRLTLKCVYDWFQFPSNGKEHGKYDYGGLVPFTFFDLFQFPSNGKEHGKQLIYTFLRYT